MSLAVELLERMNEERTATGQPLTKALSPKLMALIVLLAQLEVAQVTSSSRTTAGTASGRALRGLGLRSSSTLIASKRTTPTPQIRLLPLLPLLPFLQELERNERTVAFAFLRLFGLAQWRGLKNPELSSADWNRLMLSIIQWRLEGRLEALHTDGAMVPKTTSLEVSEASSRAGTRTKAPADEIAGVWALLQAATVVLLGSDKGTLSTMSTAGNVGNLGVAAFLRIEGAWRSAQSSKLPSEKASSLTLEIRRIYLLPKSLAGMMLSAPQLRSILALALGSGSSGSAWASGAAELAVSKGPHGASAHGFLSGQHRRRIVRRLAKLLKTLLLDLGAANEAFVIRDPWAPEEERTIFPATDALAMERRWIWRWIGEELWRWIEHDAAFSGAGTDTSTGTTTDTAVATGAAGFTAQSKRLPVFEFIASESFPGGNHTSGEDTSLSVLGHKLVLEPTTSSIRQSFTKALRDIEVIVTANPGLEDYYFLVINRRECAGTGTRVGPRSGSGTTADAGAGSACGSLQSLTAIFIECGRLPSAALWAADAAAAGVLLFHESTGSPQDWVTTRRTPFSGRIAEGYVFVLDANPAQMFAMDRNVSSGIGNDSRSRTEDKRLQWQQALMCSLAQFVWLSAVKKLLMKVKSERPPLLTPIEELARTAARFPTLTQSVLSPEAGFAMQGLLPEDEIARLQSMSNVGMILENQRLRKICKKDNDEEHLPAYLRKRLESLTVPKKAGSGARLRTPWGPRPRSPEVAAQGSRPFRKHNPLNPLHPFHV